MSLFNERKGATGAAVRRVCVCACPEAMFSNKNKSVLESCGGWQVIGTAHGGVSISAVAARWVLQQQAVGGVILGMRLGHTVRCSTSQLCRHSYILARARTKVHPAGCAD